MGGFYPAERRPSPNPTEHAQVAFREPDGRWLPKAAVECARDRDRVRPRRHARRLVRRHQCRLPPQLPRHRQRAAGGRRRPVADWQAAARHVRAVGASRGASTRWSPSTAATIPSGVPNARGRIPGIVDLLDALRAARARPGRRHDQDDVDGADGAGASRPRGSPRPRAGHRRFPAQAGARRDHPRAGGRRPSGHLDDRRRRHRRRGGTRRGPAHVCRDLGRALRGPNFAAPSPTRSSRPWPTCAPSCCPDRTARPTWPGSRDRPSSAVARRTRDRSRVLDPEFPV